MRAVLILGFPALAVLVAVVMLMLAAVRQQLRAYLVFRPLSTALIALYALSGVVGLFDRRGLLIVAALGLAALADLLLGARQRVIPVLAYGVAAGAVGVSALSGWSPTGLIGAGALLLILLLLVIGAARAQPVLSFPLVLGFLGFALMLHQVLERWLILDDPSTLVMVGAVLLLLLVVGAVAVGVARASLAKVQLLLLPVYYLALYGLALSLHLRPVM